MSLSSELRSDPQKEADRFYGYLKSHIDNLHEPETKKVVNQLQESVTENDGCRKEALMFPNVAYSGETLQYTV